MNCIHDYLNSEFVRSEKPAIIFFKGLKSLNNKEESISFNQLYKNSIKAQKMLKSYGLKKGDTILLFEQPQPNLYAVILACLGMGIKIMLLEPWMKGDKINQVLLKVQPAAILTGLLGRAVLFKSKEVKKIPLKLRCKELNNFDFREEDQFKVEDLRHDDLAIMTFTTGTSGAPKGVHRKHQFLVDQTSIIREYIDYESNPKLDLTVFTNIVLLNLSLGKGSLIVPSNWNPKVLRQLNQLPESHQVDTLACGPGFLLELMRYAHKVNLKSFHLGGALADNWIYEQAIELWPEASFHHVYGSTEAEPVAVSDLKTAIKLSKEKGFYQTLFLGQPIKEIDTQVRNNTYWVSGKHVSPKYENDPEANTKNKWIDRNDRTWHNMGDRIKVAPDGLWYSGRDFQHDEDFKTEQEVYSFLESSKGFIHRDGEKVNYYGEDIHAHVPKLKKAFPNINNFYERKIIRDVRHRSRIDRDSSLIKGVPMNNVLSFIKERVPLVANLILAFGFVFSATALYEKTIAIADYAFIIVGLLIFIIELRFMDELKDYEKDKIAHPERPLPSGLVTTKQVTNLIVGTFSLLILWSILSFVLYGALPGAFLSITTVWLFLMYYEFFIPTLLNKSPLVYAISHQVIIIPVCLFVLSIIDPAQLGNPSTIGFCLIVLGSFFSFEVGRKMDPNAHKILGTYLVHYKKVRTNLLIFLLLSSSVYGALLVGKLYWVLIPVILIVLTQVRIFFQEKKFKDLEGLIALNLIYNLWFLYIARFF